MNLLKNGEQSNTVRILHRDRVQLEINELLWNFSSKDNLDNIKEQIHDIVKVRKSFLEIGQGGCLVLESCALFCLESSKRR